MSPAFLSGIRNHFSNSVTIIDKFHVKQILLKALDEFRKDEQAICANKRLIFQGRRLFWIPRSKQTDSQAAKIASLSKEFPKTGRAYRIVCAFDDFYDKDTIEEAEIAFNALISWLKRCRLDPMVSAAKTLIAHKDGH
jgi:transposase